MEHYGSCGNSCGACMGACVHVDGVVVYFLLLVLMVADVTESQQAIVRVTPADGMQPFTMQSKGGQEERKKGKESMGEKKTRGEKLITITSKEIYVENQFAVFPREIKGHKTPIRMNRWHGDGNFSIRVG